MCYWAIKTILKPDAHKSERNQGQSILLNRAKQEENTNTGSSMRHHQSVNSNDQKSTSACDFYLNFVVHPLSALEHTFFSWDDYSAPLSVGTFSHVGIWYIATMGPYLTRVQWASGNRKRAHWGDLLLSNLVIWQIPVSIFFMLYKHIASTTFSDTTSIILFLVQYLHFTAVFYKPCALLVVVKDLKSIQVVSSCIHRWVISSFSANSSLCAFPSASLCVLYVFSKQCVFVFENIPVLH